MRKISVLFLLFFSVYASANERSMSEMMSIASDVLKQAANAKGCKYPSALTCSIDEKTYTVFTGQDKGFAIISKDDAIEPVLAYSLTDVATGEMPEALKYYLDAFQKADAMALAKGQKRVTRTIRAVEPFITTKWGQGDPYNRLSPDISGKKAPAGCVAITLSQILNYVQFPATASFTGSYTINGANTQYAKVNSTYTYPYNDTYDTSATDEEAIGVATFIRDCAVAAKMNYTVSGSAANPLNAATAMVMYMLFPYETVKYHYREFYTDAEWDEMLYGELEQGYPVYIGGHDKAGTSGHAFIAHGNDAEGNLCINWGWDGLYDGYYSMTLLCPGNNDFSYYQTLVRGFHPTPLPTDVEMRTFVAKEPYSIENTKAENSIIVKFPDGIFNYSTRAYKVKICLVLENVETGKKTTCTLAKSQTYDPMYGLRADLDYMFLNKPATGKYKAYVAVSSLITSTNKYTDPEPVRTMGGLIYYDLTVDANNNMTWGTEPQPLPVATGLNTVTVNTPIYNNKVYNLSGQTVGTDYKGIVISNGKKVIRK